MATTVKELRKKAAARQRRIIFNNDGGEPTRVISAHRCKIFFDARTTPLVGTKVDSIFYCSKSSGFGVFTHFTKIGDIFTGTEGIFVNNQIPEMLRLGLDPLKILVDYCKEKKIELFWSMRMNDTHDGASAEYGPIMFRANTIKNKHPEYLMGTIDKKPKHGAVVGSGLRQC